MISEKDITIFIFGAPPGSGFSSFPSKYVDLVSGLDKSDTEYRLECNYHVVPSASRIIYAEYGLADNTDNQNKRGGRNFGIWIEIQKHGIAEECYEKVSFFINQFLNHKLVDELGIFKEINGLKHYEIYTFQIVADRLSEILNSFPKNFIKHIGVDYFELLKGDERIVVDLAPRNNSAVKEDEDAEYRGLGHENVDEVPKRRARLRPNKIIGLYLSFSNVLLIILFFLGIFNLFKDSLFKHKVGNELFNVSEDELLNSLTKEKIQQLNSKEIRYLTALLLQKFGNPSALSNSELKQLIAKQAENLTHYPRQTFSDEELLDLIAEQISDIQSRDIIMKFQEAIDAEPDGIWGASSKENFKLFFKGKASDGAIEK